MPVSITGEKDLQVFTPISLWSLIVVKYLVMRRLGRVLTARRLQPMCKSSLETVSPVHTGHAQRLQQGVQSLRGLPNQHLSAKGTESSMFHELDPRPGLSKIVDLPWSPHGPPTIDSSFVK